MSTNSAPQEGARGGGVGATGIVVGVVIIALCAALYLTEWVEEVHNDGFSAEALRNPFLAAERFLETFNIPTHTADGLSALDELPSTNATLVISSSRRMLSERRTQALNQWVEDGGRLILVAREEWDDNSGSGDPLLDQLGVRLYGLDRDELVEIYGEEEIFSELMFREDDAAGSNAADGAGSPKGDNQPGTGSQGKDADTPSDASASDASAREPDAAEDEKPRGRSGRKKLKDNSLEQAARDVLAFFDGKTQCPDKGVAGVGLEGEDTEVMATFKRDRFLTYHGELDVVSADNQSGAQLLYMKIGRGDVVVLTSVDLWRNRSIGCLDHAYLLRWLAEDREILWWLFNTEMESLPVLLWQRFPYAIALMILALFLWAWASVVRTARVVPEPVPERRQVMEHIEGVSRFLHQQRDTNKLLAAMREDVLRGIAEPDDFVVVTAEVLAEDPERLRWALFDEIRSDGHDLVAAVRLLKRVRDHKLSS